MNFTEYLLQNRYSESTIRVHLLRIRRLQSWLKEQGIEEDGMTYPELLKYTKHLQVEKGYERQSINNELRAVKLYHDYLIEENIAFENPATDMSIRGHTNKGHRRAVGQRRTGRSLLQLPNAAP